MQFKSVKSSIFMSQNDSNKTPEPTLYKARRLKVEAMVIRESSK